MHYGNESLGTEKKGIAIRSNQRDPAPSEPLIAADELSSTVSTTMSRVQYVLTENYDLLSGTYDSFTCTCRRANVAERVDHAGTDRVITALARDRYAIHDRDRRRGDRKHSPTGPHRHRAGSPAFTYRPGSERSDRGRRRRRRRNRNRRGPSRRIDPTAARHRSADPSHRKRSIATVTRLL